MTDVEIRSGGPIDANDVLALFRHASWTADRTAADVERMLANTFLVVTAWDERLVGFMRVVSDGVYRAFVEDVIVDPTVRGQGIGRRLVEAALAHPSVRGIEWVYLFTEIPAFYRPFGFEPDPKAMRRPRSGTGS